MRHAAVIIALIFGYSFFFWAHAAGMSGDIGMFFPYFHTTVAVLTLLFVFVKPLYTVGEKILLLLDRTGYWIFPPAAFIYSVILFFTVFEGVPHIQDGVLYLYMAETFAHFKLAQPLPHNYEFFEYIFMMTDGVKHFTLFMPGSSFFLVPFVWLGITWIANPLLIALNIFLVGRFAEYLFSRRVATLAMILFLFSHFMITISATYMSHPFCATMTILSVFAFVHSFKSNRKIFPLISGFALGWVLLTRPQNVIFIGLAYLFYTFMQRKEEKVIQKAALFMIPFLLWFSFLLYYNNYFTGSPLRFIQDMHFNVTEPRENCHTFGIGRGCAHCNGEKLPYEGLTWEYAYIVNIQRLQPLVTRLYAHPLMLIFALFPLLVGLRNRKLLIKKLFLALQFLFPFIGYFFFFFNGNVYGPRYLYEGTYFLVILMAYGAWELFSRYLDSARGMIIRYILISIWITSILAHWIYLVPFTNSIYEMGFWGMGEKLKEEIEKQELTNAVVFVKPWGRESVANGFIAMDMGDFENNDVIVVKDLGPMSNSRYMHYMKGRKFYTTTYEPYKLQTPVFKRVEPEFPPSFIHIEMEDKRNPFLKQENNPDYCNIYPARPDIYKYLPFGYDKNLFLSRQALYCRFTDKEQSYTFGQYFLESGSYTVNVRAIKGFPMGKFTLSIDGKLIGTMDFSGGKLTPELFTFETAVKKGMHTLEISPVDADPQTVPYFLLDIMQFIKTGPYAER